MGIVRVPDERFIYNYSLQNPGLVEWGVSFDNKDKLILNVQYQIWHNVAKTGSGSDIYGESVASFMRGMDEAIS
jgi:hypothetical protein